MVRGPLGPPFYPDNLHGWARRVSLNAATNAVQQATYGTQQQWQRITGGLPLGIPTWIAGWDHPAATYCDPANAGAYWFGGARPWLVQGNPQTYDPDTAC